MTPACACARAILPSISILSGSSRQSGLSTSSLRCTGAGSLIDRRPKPTFLLLRSIRTRGSARNDAGSRQSGHHPKRCRRRSAPTALSTQRRSMQRRLIGPLLAVTTITLVRPGTLEGDNAARSGLRSADQAITLFARNIPHTRQSRQAWAMSANSARAAPAQRSRRTPPANRQAWRTVLSKALPLLRTIARTSACQ